MRNLAVVLLLGVLLLPGLAAAQYYANVSINADTPEVYPNDMACFTITFDHNLVGEHPATLEIYIEGPTGGYWLQGVYDLILRWCDIQERQDCLMVPACAPGGDYIIHAFLYGENGMLASQDSCVITVLN